ncbi:unnamed protein product [Polarella glacialis]|uniref:Uncharacterized protein n=1 Tax=Polarella glacialis TaxID=89957 RepID=A0A813I466_POLGL|nr:unnamed protein product [Polarella glacialis]
MLHNTSLLSSELQELSPKLVTGARLAHGLDCRSSLIFVKCVCVCVDVFCGVTFISMPRPLVTCVIQTAQQRLAHLRHAGHLVTMLVKSTGGETMYKRENSRNGRATGEHQSPAGSSSLVTQNTFVCGNYDLPTA